jgi:hypothetical protein
VTLRALGRAVGIVVGGALVLALVVGAAFLVYYGATAE